MNIPESISQEEFEKIERYLLNSMGKAEQIAFERELEKDKDLTKKVGAVKTMLHGIEEIAFREELNDLHQEWVRKQGRQKKPPGIWLRYGIAASVLLIGGFFCWWLWVRPDFNEQVFEAFYEADPGLITAMGSTAAYDFDRAMVDYKTGNYEAAIRRWESLQDDKPGNDTLNYFLGAAYLETKNLSFSRHHLQEVAESDGSGFRSEAYWYLALLDVLERDYENALIHLEKSSHPGKDKLKKTLQER
ncbi:hypothetical protein SAMN04488057_12215 [Cyclobacterium lianum]|uniref:Tetratricopeptide repeat-containing protein n=1 Tax=Cyclobacterium lianum TaxID=388280 RepID=A0A1M7QR93_9BACT|nr:hypothetical protein [Cyclobacterium lianum]SHN33910.1 hypothetical protein SAMN04488057_12215 [Cyclobacterium lianum]